MTFDLVTGAAVLAAWIYLLAGRGGFWRANVRDETDIAPCPIAWPSVVAVVPARDEAETIGACLKSLLAQDYPLPLTVIVTDDQSEDGTAGVARTAAAKLGASGRLTVVRGASLPSGWAGKTWAMKQGVEHASLAPAPPRYLLLTDADIVYGPGVLRRLVARAEARGLTLTSLMVKLRCESLAERALIPAFVFFFQMLYPFAWVNGKENAIAAAAGGCMLVRCDALYAAGGIEAIAASLIDDCALGQRMKAQGPIWLGLTQSVHSLRPYPRFADIGRMVSRSAYDQLNYSPPLLASTVFAMTLLYLMPPVLAVWGTGWAQGAGLVTYGLTIAAFRPIVRFYGLSPLWAAGLPAIAGCYMLFTLNSGVQHWRGKGGLWKGRVQARGAEAS